MEYIYENHDVKGLVITEANQSQLAEGVLAKVKGPSFFLDGYSRNGRFYPKELWENALKNPETKTALKKGLMFGCIGHPKDYSLDELLESGKVSHKVTDIYIDKETGEGIAEYEILDTPSGRILNTVLRSGSEMYVSTRAFGGFTNENKIKDGKKYKILDPKNFFIEAIDFVIQPGFLETNPKLVESLSEEFKALKEDKHNIECIDGICSLAQNENLEKIVEDKEEEMEIDESMLEKLTKEELITMLNNVVKENKILAGEEEKENITEENTDDMMVSAKLMMNYVSYVELLTKMVRYNVEYEKYYDKLIEFLDKDAKLTTNDMESLDEICDEILKEKDVDESLVKICERIKELSKKINDDGSESDKEDTSDKEDKEDTLGKEDTSTEIKGKEESFVDFVLDLKTEIVEKEVLIEDKKQIEDLKSQLLRMKEATVFLTKKLDEEISKEPKVETVTETKIEYKIPEDINEKFINLNEMVESLEKEKEELTETLKEYESAIQEKNEEISSLEEEFETRTNSLKEKVSEMEEKIESDKVIFKEILEDKENEYKSLEESLENVTNKNEELEENLKSLNVSLTETKIDYFTAFYKVERPIVKKIVETYGDEESIKEALVKEQKLARRHSASRISEQDIPEYKPTATRRNDAKRNFLESLTK